ncbi:Histone-lysine N-methyltransferase SETMAR [Araneus ventricosus]|uniref:Histone-lysine N-methyltransferase SETMAR n=1 Tax=Araneus ventricosus TaxID=182803 RepID=A0A4Y2CW51_ARAVE|nr:Histone-lysine N-methyltransferase SETMAR [Araneus ventricosus]
MLSGRIALLYDNARLHTASATKELLDPFGWEIFDHLPYSLDLAPSNFHLFLKLKEFMGGKCFGSDEELENAVTTWLNELAAEKYDMGILKLVDIYDKCLNVGGDYGSFRYVSELFFPIGKT